MTNAQTLIYLVVAVAFLTMFSVVVYNARDSLYSSTANYSNEQGALKTIRTTGGVGIAVCAIIVLWLLFKLYSGNKGSLTGEPLIEGSPTV